MVDFEGISSFTAVYRSGTATGSRGAQPYSTAIGLAHCRAWGEGSQGDAGDTENKIGRQPCTGQVRLEFRPINYRLKAHPKSANQHVQSAVAA